jgi:hypothetical protein
VPLRVASPSRSGRQPRRLKFGLQPAHTVRLRPPPPSEKILRLEAATAPISGVVDPEHHPFLPYWLAIKASGGQVNGPPCIPGERFVLTFGHGGVIKRIGTGEEPVTAVPTASGPVPLLHPATFSTVTSTLPH